MRAIFVLIFAIFSLSIIAQDIIITKDARRISAKIDEVNASQIKFHRADNPAGPQYIMSIAEIQTITYEKGEIQTFDHAEDVKLKIEQNNRPDEPINIKRWFGISIGWVFRERVLKMPGDRVFMDGDRDYGTVRDMKEISYGNTLQVGFTFSPSFKYGLGLYSGLYYEHTWAMKQKLTWITGGAQATMNDIIPPIVTTEEQTLSDGTQRRWFGAYVNSLYLPIHFQYQYDINLNMKISVSAGPSLEIGLNEPDYQYNKSRFNLLMGGRFSFQTYGAQISITTEWGVLKENFGNAYSSIYANYHRPISIQLSYMF